MPGVREGAGLYIHCGSFSPKWLAANRKRTSMTFSFSLDVPMGEEESTCDELQESIREVLTSWSRSNWVKQKKREKERKAKRKDVKHERDGSF